METDQWLAGLGLSNYAAIFAENEIDLEAARHLSDDDLRQLGLPMGPRRNLLAVLAVLSGDATANNHPSATPAHCWRLSKAGSPKASARPT